MLIDKNYKYQTIISFLINRPNIFISDQKFKYINNVHLNRFTYCNMSQRFLYQSYYMLIFLNLNNYIKVIIYTLIINLKKK